LFLGTRQFFGICVIQNAFWRLTSRGFQVTLPIVLSVFPSTSPSNSRSSRYLSSYRTQRSTRHIAGLYWVLGHAGVRGHEIAHKLARDDPVQKFIGAKPSLGFPRQINRWVYNQHLVMWRVPCSIQRQARELISGPSQATKVRLLSFNRTQSRDVTGLLTGHNTTRRHIRVYVMRLSNNSTCTEEETSVHISCGLGFTQTCTSGFLLFGP
jgi:hypothetical protein